MTSRALRALLPVVLVLGSQSGCAHRAGGDHETRPGTARAPHPAVTAKDINERPGDPIEVILASRFPGVELTRAADGSAAIRIRGGSSVNASNEPLYVLDGIPIEPRRGGSLQGINLHDIESIEVVRDPARAAQYGVRGANGIIIITTKRP